MSRREILVAFAPGESRPLGNIWRITVKGTNFYLDTFGELGGVHLSVHGPNKRHPAGHRFQVTADPAMAATFRARGDLIVYNLPRKSTHYPFDGQELARNVFRVARVRWLWDLQRPRYGRAAAWPGPVPEIVSDRSGARLVKPLGPNEAQDLDVVVSYDEPHWPAGDRSQRDNSRLGPLRNDAGMWLTATSFRRSQTTAPAPEGLTPPLPKPGEHPNRIMGGAPGRDDAGEMYWFVEGITSREIIEASRDLNP